MALHQDNFRKSGHRCLRYYCEYKKKLLPNTNISNLVKNQQYFQDEYDDGEGQFVEDERFLPW